MSDLITTAHDSYRDKCIEAFVGLRSVAGSLAERARENRGQTAAEYMGVLVVVAVIIAAVVAAKPGDAIGGFINDLVKRIFGTE
ncbi:MAG TPA: hypothetical protein VNS09_12970 [Solirubrobacter sp.]|nr:hypothetical protein [Solirubrobacter sp.]